MKRASAFLFLSGILLSEFFLISACSKKPGSSAEVRYVSASGGLRLRESPDLSAEKLLTIRNGGKVTVLEEGGIIEVDGMKSHWYKVEFAGKMGWAFGGYMTNATKSADATTDKFCGQWRGKHDCKDQHSHVKVHPDKTYTGWLYKGIESGKCAGVEIQGTWQADKDNICFLIQGQDKACYDLVKGELKSSASPFKENKDTEALFNLKR